MMKHNGKGRYLTLETERGREAHGGTLFRLGVFLLAALIFVTLLLVGGSFSKVTTNGTISISAPNVAKFEVEVSNIYDSGGDEYDDDGQYIVYAFMIENFSEVDITYDMTFKISISISEAFDGLTFYLVVDGSTIPDDFLTSESLTDGKTKTDLSFSALTDIGEEIFLEKESSETYVLVAANSDTAHTHARFDVTFSGTINITANQAKEEA